MQVLINNPFRVVGLLANCKEREIQKQKGIIRRFMDMGKSIAFETDIDFYTKCNRDETSINTSFAKIEQTKNRVVNGLFWFVDAGHTDGPALDYIRKGEKEKAVEIWNTLMRSGTISAHNYAAAQNLSTLKLGLACSNGTLNKTLLAEGIVLKAQLINSAFIANLLKLIADETFPANSDEINKLFADELIANISPYLNKAGGLSTAEWIKILSEAPEQLRKYATEKFVSTLTSSIEKKIVKAQSLIKTNKNEGVQIGESLFQETKEELLLFESITGKDDFTYIMLADKLAKTILECGIEYYNALLDADADPGEAGITLCNYAATIACSSQSKDRIRENKTTMQKWVDDKPRRDKINTIKEEYDALANTLQQFRTKADTMENAKVLIHACKPTLKKIKQQLGGTDELYLSISSTVGEDALTMCIADVNSRVETIGDYYTMQVMLRSAWQAFIFINTLDMNEGFRERYDNNKNTLRSICNRFQVDASREKPVSAGEVAAIIIVIVVIAIVALIIYLNNKE